MKLQDQVCTLDQAKRLRELGVSQCAEFKFQRYKLWNGKFKPAHTYALSLITKPSKDRFGGEVDCAEVIGNIYENPELIQA